MLNGTHGLYKRRIVDCIANNGSDVFFYFPITHHIIGYRFAWYYSVLNLYLILVRLI